MVLGAYGKKGTQVKNDRVAKEDMGKLERNRIGRRENKCGELTSRTPGILAEQSCARTDNRRRHRKLQEPGRPLELRADTSLCSRDESTSSTKPDRAAGTARSTGRKRRAGSGRRRRTEGSRAGEETADKLAFASFLLRRQSQQVAAAEQETAAKRRSPVFNSASGSSAPVVTAAIGR
ncbi:hypothetical protein PAHAL_5G112600 [Panicum hallii]|jgi:hypothetical protein|uniref:Uncharacterized protein n=1 Tax=Panicum hallii TaxID=206008 RepID=A0A2T8IJM7_9POAL|nr:hypothetical protein PAHAL_5G112600 [Panicum hallii]